MGRQSEEPSLKKTNSQRFEPRNLRDLPNKSPKTEFGLPPEIWLAVLESPASFPPNCFLAVANNLLKNPNVTASYLFRAEIFYDSQNDATFDASATTAESLSSFVRHMKADYRPRMVATEIPGYQLASTVVRKMIPRNPQLDKPLVQTCHLFTSTRPLQVPGSAHTSSDNDIALDQSMEERYLMIWTPHVSCPDDIPWYHPPVEAVATLYSWKTNMPPGSVPGNLSLHYSLFPGTEITTRMERTALNFLKITHKHGQGQMNGYTKRVHHDVVVPQKKFQDTYTYLKGKYAKDLIRDWVEQTPPTKNVFEDLGIAAFLIELWTDMYGGRDSPKDSTEEPGDDPKLDASLVQDKFPGFIDIGCGNGLLVNVLLKEGWKGWGFDARRRKSWNTYTLDVQANLKELLLIPEMFQPSSKLWDPQPPFHNGVFPTGTFIVANHADQLTGWAPLLASLSQSPFIAIPCCSHNFSGARFRAAVPKLAKGAKPPSAYAALCTWVEKLTGESGYEVEKEMLRIPSTRNAAILGRNWGSQKDQEDMIRSIVEREMGAPVETIGRDWIEMTRKFWEKGAEKDH
ncbi:DUF1613-domain-containing protein [Lophium mytilinum]|uniref:tRNA (uracil-O(2)-)-methyltransferase n=1 Tax=Lophium mytilinum TaxID=390894 RepID=A0A6A6R5L3_9PEZI|nr:DUF1613-domain-containing protein [Lophium mytilinum]